MTHADIDAPEAMTADDYAALSIAERLALKGLETENEAIVAAAQPPEPTEDDFVPDPTYVDPSVQAALDAIAKANAEQAAKAEADRLAAEEAAKAAQPPAPVVDVAAIAAVKTEAEQAIDDLESRWQDMEEGLTREAYRAEMVRLAGIIAQADAMTAQAQAQVQAQQQEQAKTQEQADAAWFDAIDATRNRYGLADPAHAEAFNKVLETAEAELIGKVPDDQIIDTAVQRYAVIAASLGRPITVQQAAPNPAADPVAPPKPQAPKPELPPTLANVPSSMGNMGDGKFAHVEAAADRAAREGNTRLAEQVYAQLSEQEFDQLVQADIIPGYVS